MNWFVFAEVLNEENDSIGESFNILSWVTFYLFCKSQNINTSYI